MRLQDFEIYHAHSTRINVHRVYVYRFVSGSTQSILTWWGSFFFYFVQNAPASPLMIKDFDFFCILISEAL